MASDAVRLRALVGREYTPADALRLRELVEHGPAELTAGLPRQLEGHIDLDTHIGTVIGQDPAQKIMGTQGQELERFLAAWRVSELPAPERSALVSRLQSTVASTYEPADWASLDAVISTGHPPGLPHTLPGFDGFSDRLPALAARAARHGRLTDKDRTGVQRFLDAWRVADMSAEDVAVESTRLRTLTPERYTARDWATLEALHGSGVLASRIDIPGRLKAASSLDDLLTPLRDGATRSPSAEVNRYMGAWRASQLSDVELRDAAKALVARNPETFDRNDWRALEAVIDANQLRGDRLRMPAEPQVAGWYTFDDLVHMQTAGTRGVGPGVFRPHFADWMMRLDPAWDNRTREATLAAARGQLATLEPNMPTAIAQRHDGDIWRLTGREQVRLAVAMLNNAELNATKAVSTPFELLSEGLASIDDASPQLMQLRDDTKTLVDDTLGVMNGRVADVGYDWHPDYAKVGRVQANASLLEQAMSIPHVQAPAAVDQAGAEAAEALVW